MKCSSSVVIGFVFGAVRVVWCGVVLCGMAWRRGGVAVWRCGGAVVRWCGGGAVVRWHGDVPTTQWFDCGGVVV